LKIRNQQYPLPQDQQGEISAESESDEEAEGRPQSSLILTLTREQAAMLSAFLKGDHRMDQKKRRTLSAILTALGTATIAPQALADSEAWERLIMGKPADIDSATLSHFEGLADACAGLSNKNQLDTAEQILSGFLPRLIHQAPYHSRIASLASRCVQLESILLAHRLKISDKITLCQQAVGLAKQATETNVLVASLLELGVAYQYKEKLGEALQTYQEALFYCHAASPILQARTYAETGAALAKCKRSKEAGSGLLENDGAISIVAMEEQL